MKSRDLFLSMTGIDDDILEKASCHATKKKSVNIYKKMSVAACICLVMVASVTSVAAIHHFWGRGMSGVLKSTDEQQRALTAQGQAIVYPELEDYSSYEVTDQGVTIAPDTVVVDDKFAYVSFKVSGFSVEETQEPAAEVNYYLGDNPQDGSGSLNGYSSFYDGLTVDDNGMAVYADGSPVEYSKDGNIISHYIDENGNLEYVIGMQAVDGENTLLGSTLHVSFSDLGIYPGKAEYQSMLTGNWDFTLKLPTVSNAQNITVNKEVPNTNFTIDSIDITPVSISVNYKVNGEVSHGEDELGIPEFTGFVLKDGARKLYVANGGSDGYTDENETAAVCARAFDSVIDISQVQSLILRTSDGEKVEVEIQ